MMIWKLAVVAAGTWWYITLLRRMWPYFKSEFGDDRVGATIFTWLFATIGVAATVLLGVIIGGIGQWVVS